LNNEKYGGVGGNQSLKNLGVIMAHDLNPYQAMVVASLLFNNENIPAEKMEFYFNNKT
jgi:L-asparaginase/Glu-tRNA(Gln) amidotransferase subunit D